MRIALAMMSLFAVAACGQTGSLYLPDETVETPVEIRTPASPPPAPAPAPAEEDEEEKNTQPPGG